MTYRTRLNSEYRQIRERLMGKPPAPAKIGRTPLVRLVTLPADQAATLPADHAATLPADNAAEVQIIPGTSVYAFASLLQDTKTHKLSDEELAKKYPDIMKNIKRNMERARREMCRDGIVTQDC